MMLKKKSNPWKLSKYLIVFPLAAIAAILFARPNLLNMNNQEGNAFIQDTLDVRHFEEILVSKSYAEIGHCTNYRNRYSKNAYPCRICRMVNFGIKF